jgi:4-hydroxyphenylpyruvate dioxygenase
MNGVDTHRTFAGQFLSDTFGSSVQHIAFETDDIFATAEALAKNGFEALPVFENYFADLDASGCLNAKEIARLKAANILYDEDEKGAYYQLYSRPYGNGFFFEIIQRTGEYSGYGAPNAPYRTAALKRLARDIHIPKV